MSLRAMFRERVQGNGDVLDKRVVAVMPPIGRYFTLSPCETLISSLGNKDKPTGLVFI